MTHTPGPWTVGTEWQDDIEIHAGPLIVGAAYSDYNGFNGPPYKCRDANARLIAAAPEMAAELRELIEHCLHVPMCGCDATQNDPSCRVGRARALVAKIDGGAR